jgi:GT2 family glycosyltransferase
MRSTDHTVDTLMRYHVRIINNPLRSVGYSRQLGVRMARYSFIMFVDSDVILTPDCISKLFHDLGRNGWAAICASVLSLENDTYWQRAEDANFRLNFNGTGRRSLIGMGATLFRKQVLLMHPFDASCAESSEDTDLFLRLSQAGLILGVSDAVVYHRHRRGFPEVGGRLFRFGIGDARLVLKYKSFRMLIRPLSAMLSYSIRCLLCGRLWLIPYWIVTGCCTFLGMMVGLHRYRRSSNSMHSSLSLMKRANFRDA